MLFLALLVLTTPARADCSVVTSIPGTLGDDLAKQTVSSGGRIYGAVGSLNRTVMPALDAGSAFAASFGTDGAFGAAHVPARSWGPECSGGDRYALYDFDLYATHLSVAAQGGPVRLFYSASVVTSMLAGNTGSRVLGLGSNYLYGTYYSLAAPAFGYRELGGLSDQRWAFDYVAGAGIDVQGFAADLGYVGSRGAYANLSQADLGLFARGVAAERFRRLPLLAAGIEGLLLSDMYTTGFVRRLDTLSTTDPHGLEEASPSAPWWTVHTAQENIAGLVDLRLAGLLRPRLAVYESLVRIHVRADPDELAEQGRRVEQLTGAWIGTIQIPEARYLGVDGGTRLQGGVRFAAPYAEGLGWLTLALAYNSEEILAAFPHAVGAWHFKMTLGGQTESL